MKISRKDGFTLVELLVTISIIILLAGLVTGAVMTAKKRANIGVAKTTINNIDLALTTYESENQEFPIGDGSGPTSKKTPNKRDDSGNATLVRALMGITEEGETGIAFWTPKKNQVTSSVSIQGWEVVVDPWGTPYIYRSANDEEGNQQENIHNKRKYDLYSCGPNKVDDKGEGDDIGNW